MFELFLITLSNKFIGIGAKSNPALIDPCKLVRLTKHQIISNYFLITLENKNFNFENKLFFFLHL